MESKSDGFTHNMGADPMSEVIDATFEDGVFKPDTPIHLPPKARVRLVVEVDGDTRSEIDRYRNSEELKAGAEQFLALIWASTYHSGGFKMTRDAMHERD